jgi:hypothetical protein
MSVLVVTVPGMEDLAKLAAREHLMTIVFAVARRDCGLECWNDDGGGAGASRWIAGPGRRRSCGRAAESGVGTRCTRLPRHTFNVAVASSDTILLRRTILLCAAASVKYDPCRELRASSRRTRRLSAT